jgi:hypothetical protein
MFIPQGITRSEMRNPPEDWDSVGIASSLTRNPPEERGFHLELPAHLLCFRPVRSKYVENPSNGKNFKISSSAPNSIDNANLKYLQMKTSLKRKLNSDPAL